MTKKILLLIVFIFSFGRFAHSQAALIILILGDKVATEEFHLSMDAGMNISTFPGLNDSERGFGVNFGLGTHIKLGEKWHLKPEFKPLSRKIGDDIATLTYVPDDLIGEKNRISLNYIDVPVLLQYNITPRIFVSAGPQVSFLTKANQLTTGKLDDGTESTIKINIKPMFNTVNFSFPVEAGYLIKLATKHSTTTMDINLFARYEYDFLEVFKDAGANSSRISLFQIGASVPFVKTAEELNKN
jgi:hypothetical protein